MRVKYNKKEGKIEIKLKEEPVLYFDECQQFRFLRPMRVYYSGKGEPAEIIIYQTIDEKTSEREEEEVTVQDSLPWRKYIFTYGDKRYQGCIDRYTDIWDSDDRFNWSGILAIQRKDGREMEENEIKEIRKDFFDDVCEYLPDLLDEDSVVSVYKNKMLYFWITEERISYPSSEEEFLEFIQNTFEWILDYSPVFDKGKGVKLIKRNIGFDLIYPDDKLTLICICDNGYWEKHEKYRVIEKEELTDRCKDAKKYKNKRIILWSAELSEKAIEYAKSQNIKIQNIRDIIREKDMKESEFNDENADNMDVPNIFGDDQEAPPYNKSTTDDNRHKKSIEYPEPADGSFIIK